MARTTTCTLMCKVVFSFCHHWENFFCRPRLLGFLEPKQTSIALFCFLLKQHQKFEQEKKIIINSVLLVRIQNIFSGESEGNEAKKHQIRMSREASCKVPRPRVIKVIDVYPSSNKMYIPSCTVLHVCADDTGCCGSPTLKCGPKSTQQITLHFLIHVSISPYH